MSDYSSKEASGPRRDLAFDQVHETLRGNRAQVPCEHIMLFGPSEAAGGIFGRVGEALRSEAAFAGKLIPLRLTSDDCAAEDMGAFWLNVNRVLLSQARQFPAVAGYLNGSRRLVEEAEDFKEKHGRFFGAYAEAVAIGTAERAGVRLVLLLDDFKVLLESLGADRAWSLRAVMQTHPEVILVGAAPALFPAVRDPEQALYLSFREIRLAPEVRMPILVPDGVLAEAGVDILPALKDEDSLG